MIKPLEDRVLVSVKQPEKTSTLIQLDEYIPDRGVVVEVGEGRYENGNLIPMQIIIGQTVIFPLGAGRKIKDGDTEYLILSAREIYAVIGEN